MPPTARATPRSPGWSPARRCTPAIRSVPRDELDATVDELVALALANSAGSIAAYKDLYRAALDSDLVAGLAYEATAVYPIDDTEARVADFR